MIRPDDSLTQSRAGGAGAGRGTCPTTIFCAAAGAGIGVLCLRLAAMPDRWVAATLTAIWIGVAALLTGRPARAALMVFVLSLQIGLALYLTTPEPPSSVGVSWPNAFALPLASLTALAALAVGRGSRILWGGGIAGCFALMALTTALSIPGSPERRVGMAHLLVLASSFVIFLAAANTVREREDVDFVLRCLIFSLVLQSLIYFIQFAAGGTFTPSGEWIEQADATPGRHGGTVGTRPAAFSSFLLPLLFLAWSQFLTTGRYGIPAVVGSLALILTFTRASWAGFGIGIVYLLAAGARRRMLIRRHAIAMLFGLVLAGALLSPKIAQRLAEDHGEALAERWALVQVALRVIEQHPLIGVGAGAYPYVFRDYLTPDLADRWLFVVHNVYVLKAAETGLPGLAALLLFLAVAFRRASPDRMVHPVAKRIALGWRAGLLALCWQMLWDVSLGPAANGLLWFLCGLMIPASRLAAEEE